MTPFLFGPPQRRLFGVFHAADPRKATPVAVLLCNPFGHEALRGHRFYRLLAERLSRQGVAALRFDYHGTGDSPGEDEDGDLAGWAQDVCEAHRELLRRSGAQEVTWFGARLGASLALKAARASAPRVKRLVLWDTVLDGRMYLEELGRVQLDELELSHSIPDPAWRRALARDPLALSGECLGYAIAPLLRSQILELRADSPPELEPVTASILAQPDDALAQRWAAKVQARPAGSELRFQTLKHSMVWTSNAHANNKMVPAEALQHVLGEVHGRR
jgi:uncharacterized protein